MPTARPHHLLTLARLARVLERALGDDLSLAQFRTLGSLQGGDERATVLAARLAVPKPTMTAVVNSLVARGLVVREGNVDDRRVVRLSITEAGRAAHDAVAATLAEVLDDVLGRCADPARALAALEDLQGALDERFAEHVANDPGSPPAARPAAAGRGAGR